MTDNAERWRNVAQAAQWLAEGRKVEARVLDGPGGIPSEWLAPTENLLLGIDCEYRLAPSLPKPREWVICVGYQNVAAITSGVPPKPGVSVRVREVIE